MSAYARLKTAAEVGAGMDLSSAEVHELAELITEHDGIECVKHDVLVRSACAMADQLEQSALSLSDRLKKVEAENERLRKAAEKVYRLRTEAPAGDKFVEFYNALILLGHALKEKN